MAKDTVEVLIEGGTATPGPPLGPAFKRRLTDG